MFETVATTILGPSTLALIGWMIHRSLNRTQADKNAAEAEASTTTAATLLLDSQRKSFETLLDPMREEITRLRARVGRVEERLAEEQSVRRHAVAFIRQLLVIVRVHAPDHTPEIPPKLVDYL